MKYKNINIQHMANTGHKVVKIGYRASERHGYYWFECKHCDWTTKDAAKVVIGPILPSHRGDVRSYF